MVDVGTGIVIAGRDDRTPLPPASLTKILTALAAVAALEPDATVPVSARVAAMPARKLNMNVGEVWDLEDTLHALLLPSANEAGAALAERISGSVDDFDDALGRLARHLGLADSPVLQDPAGLDDSASVRGGNLISARDLAIAARALLAEPRLAPIVATPVFRFTDPGGAARRLDNHNKLLHLYPGTIGLKTGYTKKSGRGLVAAATRGGRTTIVVLLGASDTYGWATRLLDAAFAVPVLASGVRLPAVPAPLRIKALGPAGERSGPPPQAAADKPVTSGAVAGPAAGIDAATPATTPTAANRGSNPLVLVLRVAAILLLCVVALRTRVYVRRWRRKRRRSTARVRRGVVSRRPTPLTPHHRPDPTLAERFHALSGD